MYDRPLVPSRERPGHAGLTEEEHDVYDQHIGELHARLVEFGDYFSIPAEIEREMCNRHRLDWVNYAERRDRGSAFTVNPGVHSARDKSARLTQYCADHLGDTIAVQDLAAVIECHVATVYAFVREHPSHARRIGMNLVYIVDPAAERARDAAVAATLPGAPLTGDGAASNAAAALAAFTGHTLPAIPRIPTAPFMPRRGLPAKD